MAILPDGAPPPGEARWSRAPLEGVAVYVTAGELADIDATALEVLRDWRHRPAAVLAAQGWAYLGARAGRDVYARINEDRWCVVLDGLSPDSG